MKLANKYEEEAALIGCMLFTASPSTRWQVEPEMFFNVEHLELAKAVNDVLADIDTDNGIDDYLILAKALDDRGKLQTVGGLPAIQRFFDAAPVLEHADYYAKEVRDAWVYRQTQEAMDKLNRDVAHGRIKAEDIAPKLREIVEGLKPVESAFAIPVAQLVEENPNLREVLIDGLLRRGETMNLVAGTKVGKSWLAIGLALSLATGSKWLGMDTMRCKVLHIDTELHQETLSSRIQQVSEAMGIDLNSIDYCCAAVRGSGWSVDNLRDAIVHHKPDLVLLDALYRAIPPDIDENSNREMSSIYNQIDKAAGRHRVGVILIHHSTKGSQEGKAITDIGSGAGAMSRAVDTHSALVPCDDEGKKDAFVFSAAVRSFPKPDLQELVKQHPLWVPFGEAPTFSHGAEAAARLMGIEIVSKSTPTPIKTTEAVEVVKRAIRRNGGKATKSQISGLWLEVCDGFPQPTGGTFTRILANAVTNGEIEQHGKKPKSWYQLPGNVVEF